MAEMNLKLRINYLFKVQQQMLTQVMEAANKH